MVVVSCLRYMTLPGPPRRCESPGRLRKAGANGKRWGLGAHTPSANIHNHTICGGTNYNATDGKYAQRAAQESASATMCIGGSGRLNL